MNANKRSGSDRSRQMRDFLFQCDSDALKVERLNLLAPCLFSMQTQMKLHASGTRTMVPVRLGPDQTVSISGPKHFQFSLDPHHNKPNLFILLFLQRKATITHHTCGTTRISVQSRCFPLSQLFERSIIS